MDKLFLPQDFGRVAVFMGGWAAEREISLSSGEAVLKALLNAGVDAVGVDVDQALLRSLKGNEYDRVFMIMHGPGGEDGVVQAYLELIGMPYTGCDVLASALAMHKLRCKQLWQGIGLPTPRWEVVQSLADCEQAADTLGLPMMLKPFSEGSSIGISRVSERDQLAAAFDEARRYGDVIAEQFVEGEELTVGILGDRALPVVHIETPRGFYDYKAKYFVDSTQYHCPADISVATAEACQSIALRTFASVGARDWGRVDFICDNKGQPWLIEINTAPGMTQHSLVPMAAQEAGLSFEQLVCRILACSKERDE